LPLLSVNGFAQSYIKEKKENKEKKRKNKKEKKERNQMNAVKDFGSQRKRRKKCVYQYRVAGKGKRV
jgi:meiotically up-regulated gene 157 (Mug157) protein